MSATKLAQKPAGGSLKLQIKVNAECVGKDTQAMSREILEYKLEQISKGQAGEMLKVLGPLMDAKRKEVMAAREPMSDSHSHEYIMCGQSIRCYLDGGLEVGTEHR
jgi:hypothetical protein